MASATLNQRKILVGALAFLFLLLGVAGLLPALSGTAGHLSYTLDDAYIHMAVAKNLVQHGVWGITRHGFTACTSSLSWPLLIAAVYAVTGVQEWAPFALGLLAACGLVWQLQRVLAELIPGPRVRLGLLGLIIFVLPLPLLIMMGMEHTLQVWLSLAFVWQVARWELASTRRDGRAIAGLAALAFALTATRYEGLFLVAAACLLFAVRRRLGLAVLLAAAAWLPITLFGIYSLGQGWFFFPASVLVKSSVGRDGLLSAIQHFSAAVWSNRPALLIFAPLLPLLALHARRLPGPRRSWFADPAFCFALLALLTAVQHILLAQVWPFYRYEAYLYLLAIVAWLGLFAARRAESAPTLQSLRPLLRPRLQLAGLLLTLGALGLLGWRGTGALHKLPLASINIHEQQYQMALFCREHYNGQRVALNDIGAVNFLADIQCIDLYGLANLQVAQLKRAGRYDRPALDRLTRDAALIITYLGWYRMIMPSSWQFAGGWYIQNNVTCGEPLAAFYASPERLPAARRALHAFQPQLPPAVLTLDPEKKRAG